MCKPDDTRKYTHDIVRPSDVELTKLLENHSKWIILHKKNKPCTPIVWANYDLSGVNFDDYDLRYANFNKANLDGATFKGATIRHADFTESVLDDVSFDNSDLAFCKFKSAKMRSTSFRQANLFRTDFVKINESENIQNTLTDLRYADFTEADMRDSQIDDVPYVIFSQFAGANLKGTMLPQNLNWTEYLPSVRLAANEARKLFAPLILLSIYLLWTVFEGKPSSHKIPLIQIEVDLSNTLIILSILITIISSYYRYYLDRLWDMISKLPDVFPDGATIIKHPDPWFIIEYTKLFLYHFRTNKALTDIVYSLSAGLLSYVIPIIALSASWFKFMQISKSLIGVSLIIFSTVFCITDTIIRLTNSYRSLCRIEGSRIISTPYGVWAAVYFILAIFVAHSFYVLSI